MLIEEAMDHVLWNQTPIANYATHYPVRDVDLGGHVAEANTPVVISFAGANADPALEEARRVHSKGAHLAWGAGPHACPAKDPAQVIATTAIERLLNALPDLELAVPEKELEWRPGPFHRALVSLPVTFSPTPATRTATAMRERVAAMPEAERPASVPSSQPARQTPTRKKGSGAASWTSSVSDATTGGATTRAHGTAVGKCLACDRCNTQRHMTYTSGRVGSGGNGSVQPKEHHVTAVGDISGTAIGDRRAVVSFSATSVRRRGRQTLPVWEGLRSMGTSCAPPGAPTSSPRSRHAARSCGPGTGWCRTSPGRSGSPTRAAGRSWPPRNSPAPCPVSTPRRTPASGARSATFDRSTLEGLRPAIARVVTGLLDDLEERLKADGEADFVQTVAELLPVRTVGEWLGIPRSTTRTSWTSPTVRRTRRNSSRARSSWRRRGRPRWRCGPSSAS